MREILKNSGFGTEDWDGEIDCPDCSKPFTIGLIEY